MAIYTQPLKQTRTDNSVLSTTLSFQNSSFEDSLPRKMGRYILLSRMVRGGMGDVYLASTTGIAGTERPCVIKRIRQEYENDATFRARFFDEARVQAQLDAPCVARILEAALDEEGHPFVAVEYVEGKSLAEVRTKLGAIGEKLSWPDAVAIAYEIASGLTHIHERKDARGNPLEIVHRDISPQNVMLGFNGEVKIIDFGTARGDNRHCQTVAGSVLAKPGYVAPEVTQGQPATQQSDLFALGVILWELISGRRFLDQEASLSTPSTQPVSVQLEQLSSTQNIPAEVDDIIAWLTAFACIDRCSRARDAADALASLLATAPAKIGEDYGTRARIHTLLTQLFPHEPATSRQCFATYFAKAHQLGFTFEEEKKAEHANQLPGTRYRLIQCLGEGTMGVVYEAEHLDLGRRVAVKILRSEHSTHAEYVTRFRYEARAIAKLSHSNLVHIHDFGQTAVANGPWSRRLFFVMELLEGETLESLLQREKFVDWREACRVAIQVCDALEVAHASGLVHRDLKPSNLFLTHEQNTINPLENARLKLLDFGIVKHVRDMPTSSEQADISQVGSVLGTPDTIAPEQVSGDTIDGRTDIYALGCVLYEMLTGSSVFEAMSPMVLLSKHVNEQPMSLRKRAPQRNIPIDVEQIVLKALSKSREARFENAAAMRHALQQALHRLDFQIQQPTVQARKDRPRRWFAPMVLTVIASAAAFGAMYFQISPHKAKEWLHGFIAKHLVLSLTSNGEMQPYANTPQASISTSATRSHESSNAPVSTSAFYVENSSSLSPVNNASNSPLRSKQNAPALVSTSPSILKDKSSIAQTAEERLEQGDVIQALQLARAARTTKDVWLSRIWAMASYQAGYYQEAHDACQIWIASLGSHSMIEPFLLDVRALRTLGEEDQARRVLEALVRKHPRSAEARVLLRELQSSRRPAKLGALRNRREQSVQRVVYEH